MDLFGVLVATEGDVAREQRVLPLYNVDVGECGTDVDQPRNLAKSVTVE